MLAPAGLPADAAGELEKAMLETMHSPSVSNRLAAGGVAGATGAKGSEKGLPPEVAYWGPELKKLGITALGPGRR